LGRERGVIGERGVGRIEACVGRKQVAGEGRVGLVEIG
jgi:hypothetical protein